jgi:hypothetical protein
MVIEAWESPEKAGKYPSRLSLRASVLCERSNLLNSQKGDCFGKERLAMTLKTDYHENNTIIQKKRGGHSPWT